MTEVIAIAKIGENALTSTNPNDFIFHSNYNTFKILLEATKNITLAASTNNQSFTQAHGIAFIPFVNGYAKSSGVNRVFLPNSEDVLAWGGAGGIVGTGIIFNYISVDATNITFNFDNTNGSTKDISIRYFCLESI